MLPTQGHSLIDSAQDTLKRTIIPVNNIRFATVKLSQLNQGRAEDRHEVTVDEIILDFINSGAPKRSLTVGELSRDIYHNGLCTPNNDSYSVVICADSAMREFAYLRANNIRSFYCSDELIVMDFDNYRLEIKPTFRSQTNPYDARIIVNTSVKEPAVSLIEPDSSEFERYEYFVDNVNEALKSIGQGYI